MPVTTGFVSTSDDYASDMVQGGAIIGPFQELATVQFTVSGATVAAQIAKKKNQDNSLHWDTFEATFAPGENGYEGEVYGIRLRSYVPGSPAVVALNAYFVDDPVPFSNPQPLDGTVDASGGFTPPATGGIQFDTNPQSGGFLDVQTTGNDGTDGMNFTAADRFRIRSTGGDVVIGSDNNDLDLSAGGAGSFFAHDLTFVATTTSILDQAQTNWQATAVTGKAGVQGQTEADLSAVAGDVKITAGGTGNIHLKRGTVGTSALFDMTSADIKLSTNSGAGIEVKDSGAAVELGFFGHAPAIQPTGVAATSAAIIAALQSIGIFG